MYVSVCVFQLKKKSIDDYECHKKNTLTSAVKTKKNRECKNMSNLFTIVSQMIFFVVCNRMLNCQMHC